MSRASTEPGTASSWRRAAHRWTQQWSDLVRKGQADGSVSAAVDAEAVGRQLHAVVSGLRINALFGLDGGEVSTILEPLRVQA